MQPDKEATITQWFGRLQRNSPGAKHAARGQDLSIHTRATQKDPQSSCDTPINMENEDVWQTPLPRVPQLRRPHVPRKLVSTVEKEHVLKIVRAQFESDSPAPESKRKGDSKEQKSDMSAVFDSQGDVIHHQPQDHSQWMMQPAASHDRAAVEHVMDGVCPFCEESFMEDVPSTEDRFIRDWDRGVEFREHLRVCDREERYKRYAEQHGQAQFWCDKCQLLSLQLWHSASLANLGKPFPLGKDWPESFFFFECDGGCGSTDFSLRTIKTIVENKTQHLLPCFCFDCRAFTKQARLIYTAREEKPFVQFFNTEPLMDCKPGCSKHAELKLIKEQRDDMWGKYWCDKCQIYSQDYLARDYSRVDRRTMLVPVWFSRCTCNEDCYWCTECRAHSEQLWLIQGRTWMEPSEDVPAHFKRCPPTCMRQKGEDAALCRCDRCRVPTSTCYYKEKRQKCPYQDWEPCTCTEPSPAPMEREDSAQGWLQQLSLSHVSETEQQS